MGLRKHSPDQSLPVPSSESNQYSSREEFSFQVSFLSPQTVDCFCLMLIWDQLFPSLFPALSDPALTAPVTHSTLLIPGGGSSLPVELISAKFPSFSSSKCSFPVCSPTLTWQQDFPGGGLQLSVFMGAAVKIQPQRCFFPRMPALN